jgi:GNAT superfamily N-acetyltransferase
LVELGGYRPGALAAVVKLHADYYSRDWNFGLEFESKVAAELSAFMQRMDSRRDLALFAYDDDAVIGSIFIDASGDAPAPTAHLRWFIVGDAGRGLGIGKRLMQAAMRFCDDTERQTVWLTTFAGLDAARALYDAHGFTLVSEADVDQWKGGVREQRFERRLNAQAVC